MALRFVVIGGGPAGVAAATHAARLGARVTVIEDRILGGAANLWDCVPSKAMIATSGTLVQIGAATGMGVVTAVPHVDTDALRERIHGIVSRLEDANTHLLESQNVELVKGRGRLVDGHTVVADTSEGERVFHADAILVSTGSRPRIPDWAEPDGDRILTTRDAYPPKAMPRHLVIIGSGVTGVEFVHLFKSLGSDVTLIVSRQQVLPSKDPEVAAELESDFLRRGVKLFKGARAVGLERAPFGDDSDGVMVKCDDGRVASGSHVLLAIGSVPNSEGLGLSESGVAMDGPWVTGLDHHLRTNLGHIYVAGDLSGKLPLASVAAMQGRKIAEHAMGLHKIDHRHIDYEKAASAIFTEPEIADVGLAEADAFAEGRKIRVTKVPFMSLAKALINNDPRGFVKILSDPATGVVLGGSIVGSHAAELISVVAVAVTNQLKVSDIAESMLVHPSLSEALSEASE